jgi:hypothetical protein
VSFGLTHPLWPNSVNVMNGRVAFELRNGGFADVTVLSLSTNATTGAFPWERKPIHRLVVPARGSAWITLRNRGCPPKGLSVRYRVLGRTMTEEINPVPLPAELRC